jgi:hypothetical protein
MITVMSNNDIPVVFVKCLARNLPVSQASPRQPLALLGNEISAISNIIETTKCVWARVL